MHVTGKVINQSDDNIDMEETISDMTEELTETFSGDVKYNGETYQMQTDIQLQEATSMDDVDKSDHLIILANGTDEKGNARGVTNRVGGKVIHLYSGDYPSNSWYSPGWSNTRTLTHEFGHAAGLTQHSRKRGNLMVSGGRGTKLTARQRAEMLWARVNRGPAYHTTPSGKKYFDPNYDIRDEQTGQVIGRQPVSRVGLTTN